MTVNKRSLVLALVGLFFLLLTDRFGAGRDGYPTLEDGIAQLLMIGYRPGEFPLVARLITEQRLGGVILMGQNIPSRESLREQITTLKAGSGPLKPWIALDQEGGQVQRLGLANGFSDFPRPRELGLSANSNRVWDSWDRMSRMIAEAGFNMNFGIVLDLHDPRSPAIGKYGRAYSSRPEEVIRFGRLAGRASLEARVFPVFKHWPGQGRAREDSHFGPTDLTRVWKPEEAEIFLAVARDQAPSGIMAGHLSHREIDERYPASLSPRLLKDRLREKEDFQGLIVTDDLGMSAIAREFSLSETVRQAILAGNDLLLFVDPPGGVAWFVDYFTLRVKALIASGELPVSMIGEAWRRHLRLKEAI